MDTTTWIIIPAYNEEKNLGPVLKEIKKKHKNVVVVDDGSTDRTSVVAGKHSIVLRHVVNLGKGAALKTGCDYAIANKATVIVAIDADGQHNPKDIPAFLRALNKVDVVFSYRKLDRKMPAVFKIGNFLLTEITKLLYGVQLQDTQCGFRAFTAKAYRKIRWTAQDYSMESEMIANAGKHTLRYTEIPIDTVYSDKYKGTSIVDGLKIAFNMIVWRLSKW